MNTNLNITYIDFGPAYGQNSNSGIERKKLAQINELSKLGDVKRLTYSPKGKRGVFKEATRMLPFAPSMFFFKYCPEKLDGVDIVYYRKAYIDRYAIKLLREIKRRNPKCIILFEIPTYPYDKEKSGFLRYPLLLKDRWNRKKLHHYVDRIVLVAAIDPIVFNVSTITISNGIDFSRTALRIVSKEEDGKVHGIVVGNFEFWHGLDRLIKGLEKYYATKPERIFVLHIVGPTENAIKRDKGMEELVSKGYLIFHGPLPFDELEKVYDSVSLAFESFGLHRRTQGQINSSVKSREYGAKGLPIVSASKIDYIPENFPYFMKVDEDESYIDIKSVIQFHDKVYGEDYERVALRIREFANDHCSSESMMRPVLDYCYENSQ
ncbi:glycosyltransferase family 1 protein [Sphaerochaeta halotolerans]|jgi:glycosyltransferase involved in cell wall biosynthesis|uniref:Glycosyltransferase family 1 protein n=1 Tax=Sphaerochaeta halotolerans TaxID=2293840 RepID=A0A372MDW7_9SPIR|nr:glycosyltransferase family 1 protein [Sphaerochaeta halotolerans]RFU93653.1 glycosyltransferase family 1 protein [Sphaerochaeta halotolerans]